MILCELLKLKRKKFFVLTTFAACIFPIPLTALAVKDHLPYETLLKFIILYGQAFMLAFILGIAAYQLIDIEKGALKNILSIPVSTNSLIVCKLLVLFIISLLYSLGALGASFIGAAASSVKVFLPFEKLGFCVMGGILTFVSVLPCVILIIVIGRNQIISIIISLLYSTAGFVIALSDTGSRTWNLQTIMPASVFVRWILPLLSKDREIDLEVMNQFPISNLQCALVMASVLFLSIPMICKFFKFRVKGGEL